MSSLPTALVTGGLGVSGQNLIRHLEATGKWRIKATSRRNPDFETRAEFLSVDLLDATALSANQAFFADVTHIFFTAYQEHKTAEDLSLYNVAMLRNTVEQVEKSSPDFQHVTFIQGGKAYGAHFGLYKTPAKETDPRHFPPNFYYDQEDYLRSASEGKSWTWSAIRPDIIFGFALGNPMNLGNALALYGSLCKELGVPLRFPGPPEAYDVLVNVTDAQLLAKSMEWVATTEACQGEIFNITNGDIFRWKHVFPKMAEFFGIECAEPQTFSLADVMRDKGPVWDRLVAKHGLQPYAFADLVDWRFGDFIFNTRYDAFFDVNKARRFGFGEMHLDTSQAILDLFASMREQRIIP